MNQDVAHHEHGRDNDAYHSKKRSAMRNVADAYQRSRIVNNDACVFKTDEGNEESYACTYGTLERCGHAIDNKRAYLRDCQKDEYNALYQYRRECKLPRVAHGEAHGVDKEGVETHLGASANGFLP